MVKKIQFGFCVPIFASPGAGLFRTPNYEQFETATTMELAKLADKLGYDSLWVADHLLLGRDSAILEGWTTLAALAGATQQARLGMIHMAHFFRYPAMTAKMVATLDQISGGRLIHFIDGGNRPPEYAAYDLPWFDSMEERLSHMIDGIELSLALWTSEGVVDFEGRYYRLKAARCEPRPLQQPHPPIWLGNAHPLMLEATARYAQGWNTTPVDIPTLRQHLQALAAACEQVGRPFETLEKSLELQLLVTPDLATARQQLKTMISLEPSAASLDPALEAFLAGETELIPASLPHNSLVGTPEMIIQQLLAYIQEGISHFMVWFMDVPRQEGLRLFAEEVAPRLRSSGS